MADNVPVTGGSGHNVAADEVVDATLGTVKVQFLKLMDGTLDSTNKAVINSSGSLYINLRNNSGTEIGTASNPVQVSFTNSGSNAAGSPLHIRGSDGSSAYNIAKDSTLTDGTQISKVRGQFDDTSTSTPSEDGFADVRITQQRALHINFRNASGTEIGTASTPIQVSLGNTGANSTALLVTGTGGTFPVSYSSGTFATSNSTVDAAYVTANTALSRMVAIGAQMDDTSTVAATEGNVSSLRIDSNRSLFVQLRSGASEIGVAAAPLQVSLANTGSNGTALNVSAAQSGTWNITNISGTVSLPSGASTLAEQQTQTTALQLIDDTVHVANAAFSKALAIGAQMDDTSTVAATEGNISALRIDANRALHVQLRSGSAEVGTSSAPLIVKEQRAATPTVTQVGDSATSITVLAANSNRQGATIYNLSSAALYLKLGATASLTSFTVKLATDDYYEVPFNYTGVIDGIWASDAGGFAYITEIV